jgi:hypothetical protein
MLYRQLKLNSAITDHPPVFSSTLDDIIIDTAEKPETWQVYLIFFSLSVPISNSLNYYNHCILNIKYASQKNQTKYISLHLKCYYFNSRHYHDFSEILSVHSLQHTQTISISADNVILLINILQRPSIALRI